MKTLFLECNMGAAGDMLLAALWELTADRQAALNRLNAMGLPGVTFSPEPALRCGIAGTHMRVLVNGAEEGPGGTVQSCETEPHHHHEAAHHQDPEQHHHDSEQHHHDSEHHHHADFAWVEATIRSLRVSDAVKENALLVYRRIAQAESHAHGRPVEQIHFHEVGTLDAVADVTGVCLLLEELAPERVICSPIHVGSGQVKTAHGILPVPAPATAWLLQGTPVYSTEVQGELCTPTGAALVTAFASAFGPMPVLQTEKIGYGMGTKDFPRANCLRAFWGTTGAETEQVAELCCNLDDMTPEELGFAQEELFRAGALDVYTTPVGMKKCRPGVLLTCMCRLQDRETMLRLLFLHTTTLGVRESVCSRYTLTRSVTERTTPCGTVRVKTAAGWGVSREKPEYEDLAAIARKEGISLRQAAQFKKETHTGAE